MTIWHIIFPIAVLIPVLVNGIAMRLEPRHGAAFGLSLLALAAWVGQMALSVLLPTPDKSGLNAAFDTVGVLAVLGCWVSYRRPWITALLVVYVAQIYLAAAFWMGWEIFDKAISYGYYQRSNNVMWLLSLALLTISGGWSVVRHARDWLRSVGHGGHSAGVAT